MNRVVHAHLNSIRPESPQPDELVFAGCFVLRDDLCNAFKLAVSVGMFVVRDVFANLASTDSRIVEPLSDRVSAQGGSHLRQTLRQILWRQVGVNDVLFVVVSGGTKLNSLDQVGFFWRFGIDLFFDRHRAGVSVRPPGHPRGDPVP